MTAAFAAHNQILWIFAGKCNKRTTDTLLQFAILCIYKYLCWCAAFIFLTDERLTSPWKLHMKWDTIIFTNSKTIEDQRLYVSLSLLLLRFIFSMDSICPMCSHIILKKGRMMYICKLIAKIKWKPTFYFLDWNVFYLLR